MQNYHGTWSAPKGHPRINSWGGLESTNEAASREFEEEIVDLSCSPDVLDDYPYVEFCLKNSNDSYNSDRCIGLYIVLVNDCDLLKEIRADKKENKVIFKYYFSTVSEQI